MKYPIITILVVPPYLINQDFLTQVDITYLIEILVGSSRLISYNMVSPLSLPIQNNTKKTILVGGLNPSEKYEVASWDDEIIPRYGK